MAFLRSNLIDDDAPVLRTGRLLLRAPAMGDFAAWSNLRAVSRGHLTPWEPQWPLDELARVSYRRRLRHYARDLKDDTGYAFLIFGAADHTLLGGISISNVRRGVTQAACLGYWIGEPFQGLGLMTEAVGAIARFVFQDLKLHRLEAACLPHNTASIRVLTHNGFQAEGLARRYLKINGAWQDHRLFARIVDDVVADIELSANPVTAERADIGRFSAELSNGGAA
jgi:[ribosomal protein S5]-alanine N-acetyltransferase